MPPLPEWLKKKPKVVTNYQEHKDAWKGCRECNLCQGRKSVVLARGNIPCDVLFIGEAPGESEDVLGRPFIGPAGKLLDEILERASEGLVTGTADGDEHELTFCYTNLVACIPRSDGKITQPEEHQIRACARRLEEMIKLANPKLIVCVGKLAEKWIKEGAEDNGIATVSITHPAAILRMHVTERGLAMQNCERDLRDAIEET